MSKQKLTKEERKLVNELFWHSFILENCYNYERQQALGFAIGMWQLNVFTIQKKNVQKR